MHAYKVTNKTFAQPNAEQSICWSNPVSLRR